ncbi:glutathione transferase GstA [Mesorhizobium amorphae]|uniref:glutathione transferase GstA n=1 Tax=Mesorhizobium amorphae TaxID=71433 RepID=UPI0011849DCA|nr:glutathione transferase GstA [Mesorhizobium amorphae]
MKLYYSPGTCSLSPHIVLRELGHDFELEKVDIRAKVTESGGDFRAINPKGYVPALKLESGEVLTEGVAIVQHLADAAGARHLAPQPGTLARTRLVEHLNFISAELHKSFGPLFQGASEEAKEAARAKIGSRLDLLEQVFADGRDFLMGESFSVADAYLFTIVNWTHPTGINLAKWPRIADFVERVAQRPTVQAALAAEGQGKAA